MNDKHESFSRRGFLKVLTMTGAAMAVGSGFTAARADGYETVGKLSDFKVGDYINKVLSDGTSVFVTRPPKNPTSVYVLSAACTHKGCPVLWLSAAKEFHCPCHGGLYDQNGVNISGPPPRPLAILPSRVVNGDVQVSG